MFKNLNLYTSPNLYLDLIKKLQKFEKDFPSTANEAKYLLFNILFIKKANVRNIIDQLNTLNELFIY